MPDSNEDRMTIIEAETTMRSTPYPTCIEVEPILQRLVGSGSWQPGS